MDDGGHAGYELVTTGDDRLPGADEVWRGKVLVRLLVMLDMMKLEVCKKNIIIYVGLYILCC